MIVMVMMMMVMYDGDGNDDDDDGALYAVGGSVIIGSEAAFYVLMERLYVLI